MDDGEIGYLRTRIAAERESAGKASCDETAALHMRMARMYEAQLEAEARRIVDRSHPPDAGIDAAMRRMS